MYRKAIPYILLFACILVIILLFIGRDERRKAEREAQNIEEEDETVVMTGNALIQLYSKYDILIEQGTIGIILYDIDGKEIPTNGYDDFKNTVYNMSNYQVIEENFGDKKIYHCYIESYENLLISLSKSPSYSKEKLAKYYHEEVEITPVKKVTTPDVEYLSKQDVINNFKGHEQEIVSGQIYFRLNENDEITSFDYLVDLEDYLGDGTYTFKKGYELTPNGTLKGYTFTAVYGDY